MIKNIVPLLIIAAILSLILFVSTKRTEKTTYKFAAGLALLAAFLLFWVNGAVGIIGSEDNDQNVMYFAIIAVGFIGAGIARFRPGGMAIAMFVTAGAQLLAFIVAWVAGWAFTGPITIFFGALWLRSAYLFRLAGEERAEAEN